jgi:hypothetical protein
MHLRIVYVVWAHSLNSNVQYVSVPPGGARELLSGLHRLLSRAPCGQHQMSAAADAQRGRCWSTGLTAPILSSGAPCTS